MPISFALDVQPCGSTVDAPYFIDKSEQVQHSADRVTVDVVVQFVSRQPPAVQWYRRQTLIGREDGGKYRQSVECLSEAESLYLARLHLIRPNANDADEYQCKVTNGSGAAMCCVNVSRLVGFDKPRLLSPATIAYYGASCYQMRARVHIPKVYKILWYRLKKNGKQSQIDDSDPRYERNAIEEGDDEYEISFRIEQLRASDRGVYRCEIRAANMLDVLLLDFPLFYERGVPKDRPQLYNTPQTVLKKDNSMVLVFWVLSSCQPSFTWIYNGKIISLPNDRMHYEDSVVRDPKGETVVYQARLTLFHYASAPEGMYYCIVKNGSGRLEVNFEVKIDRRLRPRGALRGNE